MERVETLLQQLQQQFNSGASVGRLLQTTQMLEHELHHVYQRQPEGKNESVAVSMPLQTILPIKPTETEFEKKPVMEEKIVEVLQVDEEAVAAELDEIRRNAEVRQQIVGYHKPHILFEPDSDDIPTLNHQPPAAGGREVNESVAEEASSLNDSLKEKKIEIGDKLTDLPVKDLKKAININERFLYINELFRGDEAMYERSIKTINSFSIWPEAEYWIKRELKIKLGWTDDHVTVHQFDNLVRRRFS